MVLDLRLVGEGESDQALYASNLLEATISNEPPSFAPSKPSPTIFRMRYGLFQAVQLDKSIPGGAFAWVRESCTVKNFDLL